MSGEQLFYNRPAFPAQLNMAHPLTRGLVGCWILNEDAPNSLRAWDSSPYSKHGLVTGARGRWQGRTFAGTDLIQVVNPTDIVTPTKGAVIIWFKPPTLNDATAHGLVGYGGAEARATAARLINVSSSYYLNWLSIITGNTSQVRGGTAITINNLYCGAFVSTGTTWSIYLNGVAETLTVVSGTNNGNWFGDTDYTSTQFTLGTVRYSGGYIQYYIGLQGGVWIYNRDLIAAEIRELYLDPYAMFLK